FLREAGIDVPSRMAVAGFDDIPVARFLNPPLTTVRVGIAAFGARGTQSLLDVLPASPLPRRPTRPVSARHDVIPTELVVRDSCGAAGRASSLA
ncbi:MAG TPA: substrate-binding domain-containing protein, partial [Vicinamibacterales bacterium]